MVVSCRTGAVAAEQNTHEVPAQMVLIPLHMNFETVVKCFHRHFSLGLSFLSVVLQSFTSTTVSPDVLAHSS